MFYESLGHPVKDPYAPTHDLNFATYDVNGKLSSPGIPLSIGAASDGCTQFIVATFTDASIQPQITDHPGNVVVVVHAFRLSCHRARYYRFPRFPRRKMKGAQRSSVAHRGRHRCLFNFQERMRNDFC